MQIIDDYSFVRINGKTYSITEVNVPSVDAMIHQITTANTDRVNRVTAQCQRDFVDQAFRLSNDEHTRILREAGEGQAIIPSQYNNLPCALIRGRVCPIKSVLYAPNVIRGTLHAWRGKMSNAVDASWWTNMSAIAGQDLLRLEAPQNWRMEIKGTPKYMNSMLVSVKDNGIMTSRHHYHSTGSVSDLNGLIWQSMCTGNTTGDQYWRLPWDELRDAINSINLDSLGSQDAEFSNGTFSIQSFILGMTNVALTFRSIDSEWRAGQ